MPDRRLCNGNCTQTALTPACSAPHTRRSHGRSTSGAPFSRAASSACRAASRAAASIRSASSRAARSAASSASRIQRAASRFRLARFARSNADGLGGAARRSAAAGVFLRQLGSGAVSKWAFFASSAVLRRSTKLLSLSQMLKCDAFRK